MTNRRRQIYLSMGRVSNNSRNVQANCLSKFLEVTFFFPRSNFDERKVFLLSGTTVYFSLLVDYVWKSFSSQQYSLLQTECLCLLPNSYVAALTSDLMVFGHGALGGD